MKNLLKLSLVTCVVAFFSMATASAQSSAKSDEGVKTETVKKKCSSECSKNCCSKGGASKKSCAGKKKAGKKSCSHAKLEGKDQPVKSENAKPVKGEQRAARAESAPAPKAVPAAKTAPAREVK